jgi:demethylmenaquinone methyltransferase/2-methoxy-6-polyprenyl-1,4-benzoquinol methylase/phosphoethanolamine N-methyltransferase
MMVEKAGIKPGDHVLDVGCGPGDVILIAKAQVGPHGQAVGIDAAPEMIEVARQKAARAGQDVDFKVALIEKLPFPDGSFDAVLSSLMMHHLPDDIKREGLAEVRRVLKPGGCLMIVDMKRPESWLGRALLPLMLHRSMPAGVQDLPPLVQEMGFERIESGNTRATMIGYVRGYSRISPLGGPTGSNPEPADE